jgi:tetratricopeptide (TPR) repeat protein
VTAGDYAAEEAVIARGALYIPASSELYRMKIAADTNTGDTSRAMSDYAEALEFARSPTQRARALTAAGDFYMSQADYATALGVYKQAVKAAPALPDAWVGNATALATQGQTEPAADIYETAERRIGSDPGARAAVYLAYGNFLLQLGDRKHAAGAFKAALRLPLDSATRAEIEQRLASAQS